MDKFHSKVTDKELEDFLNNPELNKIEATGDFFIETFLECFLMKTRLSFLIISYKLRINNLYFKSVFNSFENYNRSVS